MIRQSFILFLLPSLALSQSQCSNFWQYIDNSGQIQGLLTLTLDNRHNDHHVQVILTVGTGLPSEYVGSIGLLKNKEIALNDIKYGLSVQYLVRFPIHNPLPKLTEVRYNNRQICIGDKAVAEFITTITLNHSLMNAPPPNAQNNYGGQNNENIQQNQNQYSQNSNNFDNILATLGTNPPFRISPTQAPTFQQSFPNLIEQTQKPSFYQQYTPYVQQTQRPQPTTSYYNIPDQGNQCGIPLQPFQGFTSLVINGIPAFKGQFPWLAALFHNGINENGFICGGTLVSSKAIVTAAHCIHNKNDYLKRAEEMIFYIGKFLLTSFTNEKDFIVAPVSRVIVHPDWNPKITSYDGDIAVALLYRVVQFTQFIRPICLWTTTNNYHDIINQQGVLAGYGKTHVSITISDRPFWTSLPIVDEATCLRSKAEFSKITSRRTFCVGSRDGRGPCNGDSGGPLVVQNNGRWYLRGIVSSSLFDRFLYTCDTTNYAVFTDVAAFSQWLQQYI